ncbi:PREDICTED: zinc finger BED domain-containing protein 5-like [Myotis davidii]|uniref:zinc finger BED domain-containing protein 5-like n=1 Tax=Myotis davidii TaxID=225400 RepID=UPI000767CAB7|nr:PREDICTED: zinc finger BED domain-containing protein 5-like [Myotis davidii]
MEQFPLAPEPSENSSFYDSRNKHLSFASKDTNYFRSKADGLKKGRLDTGGKYHEQNVAAVEASYLVTLKIDRGMKPHTIAEDLLLPVAKDIVRGMIGDEFVTKLSAISLSNDTVRRIDDMYADILDQVTQEIKSAPLPIFNIQIDKSTDVANCSQLLVYVRYINDGDFKDEFPFCKPLETTATACDVFDTVGSFLKEMVPNETSALAKKKKKMDENKNYMLSTLSAFFEEHDIEPDKRITMMISVKEHLHMLADEISSYFPNLPETPFANARSPFTVKVEDVPETAQEEFIELINNDAVRTDFSTMPVTKFWIKCLQSYPVLSETVLCLLPFPTTYLCETGFSSFLVIKSKYRSRLVVEDDVHCALAKTAPRISDLVRKKQSQPSH